jgi:peptidoglycan lytic transglycosylase
VKRRATPHIAALVCALAGSLCLPALGAASSGGSAVGPAPGSNPSPPYVQPGNVTLTASGNGMTITARASALLRKGLTVSGSLAPGSAGKMVVIELRGAKTHWAWISAATARVRSDGSFSAVWQANHIGRFAIRAVVGGASGASAAAGLPTVTVTVYRPSLATLYGPGFWGSRTACGKILRRSTIGVANRTLPCGTPVAIYYGGRTLIVPVVDRGPYANGADWDLTMATAKTLGISTTATIGAVSLPRAK